MFTTKKVRELQSEVESLEREVERLEQQVKSQETDYKQLWDQYNKYIKDVTDESRDLPVTLNFGAMGAFSVERLMKNDVPVTVIGYFVNERIPDDNRIVTVQKVKEWYLYCSDKVHKDIVKQFNEYMEERKARLF